MKCPNCNERNLKVSTKYPDLYDCSRCNHSFTFGYVIGFWDGYKQAQKEKVEVRNETV